MNSEEDDTKNKSMRDPKVDSTLPKNDSQLMDQACKSSKVTKIQNKLCSEQFKLNNSISDSELRNALPSKFSTVVSNGTRSTQTVGMDPVNSLETNDQDISTNTSSIFTNATNIKPQVVNANTGAYSKHKNLSNHQAQLNLPTGQLNVHFNHPASSASYNSSTSNVNLHTSASTPVPTQNLSPSNTTEDIDMKNNVDYASGIEKCPSKVSCSSDSSPEADCIWTSKSYVSKCTLNNIGESIGSTSQGTCCFLRPNINGNREGAGPSGLQRNTQREQIERRDSSSGNEGDLSDGEDYCIYTYKGNDNTAEVNRREEVNEEHVEEQEAADQCHSGRSSPEMDFLEMDFDPGPSCEQDTGDSDLASINEEIQNIALDNAEPDPVLNDLSSGKVVSKQNAPTVPLLQKQSPQNLDHVVQPSCSNEPMQGTSLQVQNSSTWMPSTSSGTARWEPTGFYRNIGCPLRESYGYHNTSGDLISPGDNRDIDSDVWTESSSTSVPENSSLNSRRVNLSSTLYHRIMAKKLMLNKQAAFNQSGDSNLENELCTERLDGILPIEKVMLWSEQEATVKQVTQIATSACGATAAINALLAIDVSFSSEVLVKSVGTRLREPGTPLPRYLVSRSLAGSTHKDIARGISLATNGAAVTKFFSFYPERKVLLSHWLHYWISKGAAPIATLNLQHCGEGCDIPDAWHHQMIFGIGQAGIYLTNPLQCVPEQLIWHQLVNPSVLLIRRADVLAHWNTNTDLTPLAQMDKRWRKYNVLGQVVNVVREAMSQRPQSNGTFVGTTHIRIPASYKAGITLVVRADSPAAAELLHAEQLPLL